MQIRHAIAALLLLAASSSRAAPPELAALTEHTRGALNAIRTDQDKIAKVGSKIEVHLQSLVGEVNKWFSSLGSKPTAPAAPELTDEKAAAQLGQKLRAKIGDANRQEIAKAVEDLLQEVGIVRAEVMTLMRRAEPDLHSAVKSAYQANFSKTSLEKNIQGAYGPLGLDRGSTFEAIAQKLHEKTSSAPPSDMFLWRQIGYVFGNKYTKQEYDAFLDGDNAVQALTITPAELQRLEDHLTYVFALQVVLRDVQSAATSPSH